VEAYEVLWWVCLSVCLSTRITWKPHGRTSPNFLITGNRSTPTPCAAPPTFQSRLRRHTHRNTSQPAQRRSNYNVYSTRKAMVLYYTCQDHMAPQRQSKCSFGSAPDFIYGTCRWLRGYGKRRGRHVQLRCNWFPTVSEWPHARWYRDVRTHNRIFACKTRQ